MLHILFKPRILNLSLSFPELDDKKPPSAKTITLRPKSTASVKSNGSAVSPVNAGSNKRSQNDKNKTDSSTQNGKKTESEQGAIEGEEEEAATKIQAAFRGHKARQSMKQPATNKAVQEQHEAEPTREQLEEEFRADDQGRELLL